MPAGRKAAGGLFRELSVFGFVIRGSVEEVPVDPFDSELPIAELPDTMFFDPEDPMIERAMRQRMDGAYGSTWSAFTTRSLNNETLRKGIDVSAWQDTINWTKVKNAK